MRCPKCRKEIPFEAVEHVECGWNVDPAAQKAEAQTRYRHDRGQPLTPGYGSLAVREARAAMKKKHPEAGNLSKYLPTRERED